MMQLCKTDGSRPKTCETLQNITSWFCPDQDDKPHLKGFFCEYHIVSFVTQVYMFELSLWFLFQQVCAFFLTICASCCGFLYLIAWHRHLFHLQYCVSLVHRKLSRMAPIRVPARLQYRIGIVQKLFRQNEFSEPS